MTTSTVAPPPTPPLVPTKGIALKLFCVSINCHHLFRLVAWPSTALSGINQNETKRYQFSFGFEIANRKTCLNPLTSFKILVFTSLGFLTLYGHI